MNDDNAINIASKVPPEIKPKAVFLILANTSIVIYTVFFICFMGYYESPNDSMYSGLGKLIMGVISVIIGSIISTVFSIIALLRRERPLAAYILPTLSFVVLIGFGIFIAV